MSAQGENSNSYLAATSAEAKNFYSAGSTFTALGCATVVCVSWGMLDHLWSRLGSDWVAFSLTLLIVYAYAFVLPEPPGDPDAGKLRLTLAEAIFGFFNVMIVFAMVVGIKDGLAFHP